LPVSGAMFFDKEVILLLFVCCSYDVIFAALDANAAKRSFDLIERVRKCRDRLFDD